MSSDEASDEAMDFEDYYGDDDDQYNLDSPYSDSYELDDHVRNIKIERHGTNGLRFSWKVDKADDSDSEDCEVFIQLYCDGNPLGDKQTVSDSFACFENLEHFKKYSADVWTADEEPEDVEIVSNDSRCSEWILLGEEEFSEVAKKLLKYVYVLEKKISQEEDEAKLNNMKQMHEDISQLGNTIYQGTRLPSQETLYGYKETLQTWFNEKSFELPDIQGLEISVNDKGVSITASWKAIAWPNNLQYAVQVFCNQTQHGDVKIVSGGSFAIQDPDPTKKYMVEIWSICGEETGIHTRSDEIMICKDLGNVLVNCTKPLREGYRVYEGYLKGACGKLDKVAIKIVNASNVEKLWRELKINEELRPSQFLVRSLGSGDIREAVERQAYIALELCKSDTLFEMVKKSELRGARRKKALSDIIEGLQYIHLMNILHRDLKPQNILCSLNGEDSKISDFGLSKQTRIAMSKVSKSAHEIGTEGWGSPEHYEEGAEMSEESDIYSAGLVFFFVLSDGKHAMGENEYQWKAKIIQGAEVDYTIADDEDADIAQDLIQKMLAKIPSDRPSAEMVFYHPFFMNEYERLEYLRRQAQLFARFTYAKNPASPDNATAATIEKLKSNTQLLETRSGEANWLKKLEEQDGVLEKFPNLMKKAAMRQYDHSCIFHLLRFIRNTYVHFKEDDLREEFDNSEENVWRFFSKTFPGLICAVYNA